MKMWLSLLVCFAMGVAAIFVDPDELLDLRTEVVTFLSILLGAVLFRLGRGLPQLAVAQLPVQEVKRIADAFKVVTHRLMWVFAVTSTTILLLISAGPILHWTEEWPLVQHGVSFFSASLSCLAVVRAIAVVLGDLDLVNLQAELVKRDAEKRRARDSSMALDEAERSKPFVPSKDYGDLRSL